MFNKIQINRHKFLIILIFYIIMIFDNNKLNFGMANYIESSSSSIVMNDSNSNNNNTTSNRTVKKQLNDTNIPLSDNFNKNNKAESNKDKNNLSLNPSVKIASNTLMPTIAAAKVQQHQQQMTASTTSTNDSNTSHTKNMKNIQDFDIPNSFRVGFYIFIGLGIVAIIFISYRSYRFKLSRAERRYGVQGDRRAQELTPLPVSIEDESDTEDHTLFDIHKQIRIS